MTPRVSAVVREFADLEIGGPAEPTESPLSVRQHVHGIATQRIFSEIDEGRRVDFWRLRPEDHGRDVFQQPDPPRRSEMNRGGSKKC